MRSARSLFALCLGCALPVIVGLIVTGASGAATAPRQLIRIDGATGGPAVDQAGGLLGVSVARAGDVNGDGLSDVVIGAPLEDNNGRVDSGSAYVVFGQAGPTTIDLANLGNRGFRIDGAAPGDLAGRSVSGGRDVNGDRISDLLIGAPRVFSSSEEGAQARRGTAYVVFGKSTTTTVDLSLLGGGGFQITGRRFRFPDAFGLAVSIAGDIDRDGHADLVVAAPGNPGFEEVSTPPAVYVIYGKRSASEVRVDRLGRRGFKVVGVAPLDISVAGAGDGNNHRRADIIIGNDSARVRHQQTGAAYVIFGRRYRKQIDLQRPTHWGYRILGTRRLDSVGQSVAGAGDVNGDRRDDVIVGAPGTPETRPGAAYVVFGKRGFRPVGLAKRKGKRSRALGSHGFKIAGEAAGFAGNQVAGLGDVNGDRRPDVALIAGGSVYVIYGKRSTSEVRLAALDNLGFQIDGAAFEPISGPGLVRGPGGFFVVAGAGDMNRDGRGEILIGAPNASHNGRPMSGSAYVFYAG
jgi:hypothetical protein